MKKLWIPALALASVLTGCGGEVAFKRGAGAEALETDQNTCRRQTTVPYSQCMESRGWTLHRMDESNPLMVIVPNPENRAPGETYVPKQADKPASKLPPDPMEVLNVSSWWKTASGPDDLKQTVANCENKLGDGHKASPDFKRMTRGMVLCLRESGWYGLQGY